MKREITGHGPHVQGYAWHAYPDPATPGVFVAAGDLPIEIDEGQRLGPSRIRTPDGVVRFWRLRKGIDGFANDTDGHTFLLVTEHLEPPRVTAGWFLEDARVSHGFAIKLDHEHYVVLLRVIDTSPTPWGPIRHCEFEIDEE